MCMYSCRCNVSSCEKELPLSACVHAWDCRMSVCLYVCPSAFRPAGISHSMKQVNLFILDHFPITHRNGAEPFEKPIPYCLSTSAFKSCMCLIKCDSSTLILWSPGILEGRPVFPAYSSSYPLLCISLGVWDTLACNLVMSPILTRELTIFFFFFGVTYFLKCGYKPRQIPWNLNYARCSKEIYISGRKGKEPEACLLCHPGLLYWPCLSGASADNCPAGKAAWLGAAVGPTKLAEQEVEKAEVW